MSNIHHLQSLHHSQLVLEALKSRRNFEILIEGNDKLRSPSSGLWIWSPLIRSIFGSLTNMEETVVIVPDFSSEDIKTCLDVIDTEYKELLRFNSRTKNLLETLGVNLEAREDDIEKNDANTDKKGSSKDEEVTDEELIKNQEITYGIDRDDYSKYQGIEHIEQEPAVDQDRHDTDSEVEDEEINENDEIDFLTMDEKQFNSNFENNEENVGERDFRYPCNQCDQQFTLQNSLQKHIQSVHEGIKYSCNQCDYQAPIQGSLQRHIQSVHEGLKYPCSQCDYQATRQSHLQTHISAKHSDTVHKCEYCDFQTKWRTSYSTHIRSHLSVNSI